MVIGYWLVVSIIKVVVYFLCIHLRVTLIYKTPCFINSTDVINKFAYFNTFVVGRIYWDYITLHWLCIYIVIYGTIVKNHIKIFDVNYDNEKAKYFC